MQINKKKIVVVGGGAAGLELVAKLCNKFKRSNTLEIILIDKELRHIWKPLYHEVAAGTFTRYHEGVDYITYSYQKGFKFIPGILKEISYKEKWILLELSYPENNSLPLAPYQLHYDILILALGSQSNDFNIPGVRENCFFLDSLSEAELFNKALLKQIILSNYDAPNCMHINIVGGGATGVELSAELNDVLAKLQKYSKSAGLPAFPFQITVLEAGNRLLNTLPIFLSQSVHAYLHTNKINVLTDTQVKAVKKNGLITVSNKFIKSDMTLWAAGVKGNASFLHNLEINKLYQFKVRTTLQTTKDDSIFALGDCASCPQMDKKGRTYFVPPRAQAASQQADFLINALTKYLQGETLPLYHYRDYGSLISLSRYKVMGYLRSKVIRGLYIKGFIAKIIYWLLYKKHLFILKGVWYVILNTLADFLTKKQRPKIKLH